MNLQPKDDIMSPIEFQSGRMGDNPYYPKGSNLSKAAEEAGISEDKYRKMALVFASLNRNKKKTEVPNFRQTMFRNKKEDSESNWTDDFLKTVQFL